MKSFALALFVVSAVSLTCVSAKWKIGSDGLVLWDFNCDFYGHDIDTKPSTGEQCGGVCIANPDCTHFTHHSGTCYLKKNTEEDGDNESIEKHDNYELNAVCGFILGRSDQPTN